MFLQLDNLRLSLAALDTSPPPQRAVLDSCLLSEARLPSLL